MEHRVLNLCWWAPPLCECSSPSSSFCCLFSRCNESMLKEISPKHPATESTIWCLQCFTSDTPFPFVWFITQLTQAEYPAGRSLSRRCHCTPTKQSTETELHQGFLLKLGQCWLSAHLMKKVTKLLHRHQANLVSQTVSSSKPHYT